MIGAPDLPSPDDIIKLSSRFPTPTNAVALAALDGVTQWVTSDAAKRVGIPADVADSFLAPDGILLRMRALAAGWTKPGDKLRAPSDVRWWTSVYRFPLWNPLGTYVDGVRAAMASTGATPGVNFDEAVALGDSVPLSRVLAGMREEIAFLEGRGDPNCKPGDLCEAPCPPWLIPPGKRGTMPVPNPDCAAREVERKRRELDERRRGRDEARKQDGIDWVILLGVGVLVYLAGKKAMR